MEEILQLSLVFYPIFWGGFDTYQVVQDFGTINSIDMTRLGVGFKHFLNIYPYFGEMIQFDSFFADGLKPPTRIRSNLFKIS